MPYPVTGQPDQPVADAMIAALRADAELVALVSGIYTHVPDAARVALPYVLVGRVRAVEQAGAMGAPGWRATVQIDQWSDYRGTYELSQIQGRIATVFERQALSVTGYAVRAGSLTCDSARVFTETDPDMPERTVYHGVQEWSIMVDQS